MVLYFSGTGNSALIAKKIAELIGDNCFNLFNKIKHKDHTKFLSSRPYVIVCPTYGWQIPRILEEWILKTELSGSSKLYFILTCGQDIGNAQSYIQKLCSKKMMTYMGCYGLVMPENYLAMFPVPDKDEALKIITKALKQLPEIAKLIKSEKTLTESHVTVIGRLCSNTVNKIFYRFFVHDKKFRAKDSCIACGQCINVCPLNNISLRENTPIWHGNCTHCMSCITKCPVQAIEYGKISKGKPRYQCPDL